MVVAFCIYEYFPYGGLQRDFFQIARQVSELGHTVRVYIGDQEGELPDNFEIVHVPTRGISNHTRNENYYAWVNDHILKHPVDRVVGFNRMPGLDFYYAGDLSYAVKNQTKSFFYKLLPRYRHFYNFEKAVFAPNSQTHILYLTANQKSQYQSFYGTQEERFHHLPPGVDRTRSYEYFSEYNRERFRRELGVTDKEVMLLQVCSNYYLKGVDRSLEALSAMSKKMQERCKLFVVGADDAAPFEDKANKMGVAKNVRFFKGRDDIGCFMGAANLMLHPARHEAAGIVIVEALASALPIIVTNICGYADYIENAKSGILLNDPFNQSEFNKTVQYALENEEFLLNCRKNAKAFLQHTNLYGLAEKAAALIVE